VQFRSLKVLIARLQHRKTVLILLLLHEHIEKIQVGLNVQGVKMESILETLHSFLTLTQERSNAALDEVDILAQRMKDCCLFGNLESFEREI